MREYTFFFTEIDIGGFTAWTSKLRVHPYVRCLILVTDIVGFVAKTPYSGQSRGLMYPWHRLPEDSVLEGLKRVPMSFQCSHHDYGED